MNAAATPARQMDPKYGARVLGVLAVMAVMVTYVETMVLPAFSNFEQFFGVYQASTIVWILSAYLLVGVVVTPIFGKLGDIYGKKRMLLVAMGIYAIAVSVAGFTPNIGAAFGFSRPNQIYVLIGVRAVQGIGMAMFPLGFAMLPEIFPPAKVGQAQGILSGMFATGAALGLVGGGWIAETYGWQVTYHTVIPVAILVFVLALFLIRESPNRASRRIDFIGAGTLGIGLAFLMLGITEGQYWGWTNWTGGSIAGLTVGVPEFFLIAVICFAIFLVWEPRAPSPIVSFQELKQRNIWVSNLNGVLVGMTMFLLFTVVILIAEEPSPGFHLTELNAGLVMVPAVIGMMTGGPMLGRMIPRFGPKPVMTLGFLLIVLGSAGMLFFNRSIYQIAGFAVPVMIGNVAVLISMSNIIVLSVDPKTMGVQTGMNQTFRNLGSAIGPVLVSTLLAAYSFTLVTPYAVIPDYRVAGYALVFGLVAAIGVLGAVCSLALRNFRFSADGTRSGEPGEVAAKESPSPAATPTVATGGRP